MQQKYWNIVGYIIGPFLLVWYAGRLFLLMFYCFCTEKQLHCRHNYEWHYRAGDRKNLPKKIKACTKCQNTKGFWETVIKKSEQLYANKY